MNCESICYKDLSAPSFITQPLKFTSNKHVNGLVASGYIYLSDPPIRGGYYILRGREWCYVPDYIKPYNVDGDEPCNAGFYGDDIMLDKNTSFKFKKKIHQKETIPRNIKNKSQNRKIYQKKRYSHK